MCVCSATNRLSKPASSAARATSRMSLVRSVAKSATPRCTRWTLVEGDDLADDLAGGHRVEGSVHVVEGQPARDHRLEVEAADPPQVDQPGEVAVDVRRPVVAAAQGLLVVEDLEGGELHHVLGTTDADDDRRAAPA